MINTILGFHQRIKVKYLLFGCIRKCFNQHLTCRSAPWSLQSMYFSHAYDSSVCCGWAIVSTPPPIRVRKCRNAFFLFPFLHPPGGSKWTGQPELSPKPHPPPGSLIADPWFTAPLSAEEHTERCSRWATTKDRGRGKGRSRHEAPEPSSNQTVAPEQNQNKTDSSQTRTGSQQYNVIGNAWSFCAVLKKAHFRCEVLPSK